MTVFHPLRQILLAVWMAAVLLCLPGHAGAQSISTSQNLSFGTFTPGGGGTVVVSPAGARTATGGVTLFTAAQFSQPAAASYIVANPSNGVSSFTITLPASSVILTRTGGTATMSVGTFTSNPVTGQGTNKKGFGQLAGGSGNFTVGATLTVGASQAAGTYTGTYSVTVAFP